MLIAGVDEVGRGCLAGPVMAAAVILPARILPFELKDSKKLSHKKRLELSVLIKTHAIAWAIGRAEVEEIDRINILQASLLAMKRAVESLSIQPSQVLIDGNQAPKMAYQVQTIIKGDETEPSISAASIIAKVARDLEMIEWAKLYPNYQFEKHKGYGTAKHLNALKILGVTSLHRRSFQPVRAILEVAFEEISIG